MIETFNTEPSALQGAVQTIVVSQFGETLKLPDWQTKHSKAPLCLAVTRWKRELTCMGETPSAQSNPVLNLLLTQVGATLQTA